MENLVIRKATINDLKEIQRLNKGLFDYEINKGLDNYIPNWAFGEDSAEYFTDLILNQFVIIAEVDGMPVGYLAGRIYQDSTYSYYEGLTAELDNVYIDEQFRKYGIGTKFITSFIDWCKTNNAKRILVVATIGNDDAIAFYKKQGFVDLNLTLRKDL